MKTPADVIHEFFKENQVYFILISLFIGLIGIVLSFHTENIESVGKFWNNNEIILYPIGFIFLIICFLLLCLFIRSLSCRGLASMVIQGIIGLLALTLLTLVSVVSFYHFVVALSFSTAIICCGIYIAIVFVAQCVYDKSIKYNLTKKIKIFLFNMKTNIQQKLKYIYTKIINMKLPNHTSLYLLLIITIIAAALRFYHLGWQSLWLDEAATLWYSSSGYDGVWKYVLSGEYNPPLFYWITTFMLNFGDSEFVLRFIPCVVGVLTIPVVYLLGKEWRNETVGLVAAALLAFSPFHIYYSQEARAYTLAVLLVVLMLYSYLRAAKTNQYKWWILMGVLAGLAFWTHFYTFLPSVLIGVYHLISTRTKDSLKHTLIYAVTFIWTTLPMLLAMGFLISLRTDEPPTFGIQGPLILTDLFWNYGSFIHYVSIVFFILMLIGFYLLFKQDKTKFWFASFIIGGCLLLTVPLSYKIPMVSRYLLYLLPLILLVISEPLTYLKDKKLIALFTIGFIVLGLPTLNTYYSEYSKDDWRGYGEYLNQTLKPGNILITIPAYMDLPLNYYYNMTEHGVILHRASNVSELEWYTVPGRTWYTMTPDIGAVDPKLETVAWLKNNTEYVNQWKHYIYTYKR